MTGSIEANLIEAHLDRLTIKAQQHGASYRKRGRPKGVPNRSTREIKMAAQKYGPRAVRALARLARTSKDESIQLRAWQELLARGYGKPMPVPSATVLAGE